MHESKKSIAYSSLILCIFFQIDIPSNFIKKINKHLTYQLYNYILYLYVTSHLNSKHLIRQK